MKTKITLSFIAVILFTAMKLSAQVPNGGFESWVPDSDGILYPDQWQTTNSVLDTNVLQYSPACQGNYGMLVRSWDSGFGIFGGMATIEFPYTLRPTQFTACIRATLMPGDTAFIFFNLWQGSTAIAAPDSCTFRITSNITTWTSLTFPISYLSPLNPDSASVFIMSGLANSTQLGTEIMVDGLSFGFGSSINEPTFNGSHFASVSPNPAKDMVSIALSNSENGNAEIVVYDLLGNIVKQISASITSGNRLDKIFSVAELPAGIYPVKITSGKKQWMTKIVRQ